MLPQCSQRRLSRMPIPNLCDSRATGRSLAVCAARDDNSAVAFLLRFERPAFASHLPRSQASAWECLCLRSSSLAEEGSCATLAAAPADEAELRGQVRSQAGAWERGTEVE